MNVCAVKCEGRFYFILHSKKKKPFEYQTNKYSSAGYHLIKMVRRGIRCVM